MIIYINNKTYNLQELFNNIELIKISNLEKLEIQLYLSDKYIYYEKINILNQLVFLKDVIKHINHLSCTIKLEISFL